MKTLTDCKDKIHSCSKCGLCQSVCPIYKITGNDCTVSRGHFIMLRGLIKKELKMSKKINYYLDLCLKCGACTKFCPSGIDVVDIVTLAKAEYFKSHISEKFISWFQKTFIFGLFVKIISLLTPKPKSKKFNKKILFFSGCGKGNQNNINFVIKSLNRCGIEVVEPDFKCCGIPFFVRGDMKNFEYYINSFYKILDKTGLSEVVTTCASCEKTLKSYKRWKKNKDYTVKNIYEYLKENDIKLKLKKNIKVTFHKPCNISNFETIKWLLNNTENLDYTEMDDYDKCCGLNGISKFSKYGVMFKLYKNKRKNIIDSGANIVLTSCLGCEIALKLFSFGRYKVYDFCEFMNKYTV